MAEISVCYLNIMYKRMNKVVAIFLTFFIGTVMAAEQTISNLSEADKSRLDQHRAVVEKYLSEEDRNTKYLTAAGKLGLLRALLDAKTFSADQTYELQSMGIVFGDAFVENMGFHWVTVEDEYGRDPALKFKETNVLIFPLTMISKRIEKGEEVDVFDLFNGVADQVEEILNREQ